MKTYNFDELLASFEPEVVRAAEQRYRELRTSLPLPTLRAECEVTQSEMASRLGVSQAAVSKLEARKDVLLSTLTRYVEALGGKCRVAVDIDTRSYTIEATNSGMALMSEHDNAPVLFEKASAKSRSVGEGLRQNFELWDHRAHATKHIVVRPDAIRAVANECTYDSAFAGIA